MMSEPVPERCNMANSGFHGLVEGKHDYYYALESVLKYCATFLSIPWGKAMHTRVIKTGHLSRNSTTKALLNMYARCRHLEDCKTLFVEIPEHDRHSVFWNILISGFSRSGTSDAETMSLFNRMHAGNHDKPSSVTVAIILPVCARSGDVRVGRSVHCYAVKSGLARHTVVGNALVSMYSKRGLVRHDAFPVFEGISNKDVVSWNSIIAGFSDRRLTDDACAAFRRMLEERVKPNHITIATFLSACGYLDITIASRFVKEMHCYVLQQELFSEEEKEEDTFVYNALMSFYLRVGLVEEAELVFQGLESRDLISWNALIAGYASNGALSKSMELFSELVSVEKMMPDSVTIISILPVCAQLMEFQVGRMIHGHLLRHHACFCRDTSVGNAMVSFYARCNNTVAAYQTFLMICNRDLISWNTILDALAEAEHHHSKYLEILQQMLKQDIRPDHITIFTIFHYSVRVSQRLKVKETHSYIIRHGLLSSHNKGKIEEEKKQEKLNLVNALIDAYAKCGQVEYAVNVFDNLSDDRNLITFNTMIAGYIHQGLFDNACKLFDKMPAADLTTWNLMIRAYVENNSFEQAVALFHQLKAWGTKLDAVSIMSLLPACSCVASMQVVKQCHAYAIRGFLVDLHLIVALLTVYAKCGDMGYSSKLFKAYPRKDQAMFTAMVGAYGLQGMGKEALGVFSSMIKLGIKPDHVFFISLLSACSHAGLVHEGLRIFSSIEKVYQTKPTLEQYSCVADLLARRGWIDDARSLVEGMPIEPNAMIWATLLGACRIHHEVGAGHAVAARLFESEETDIGNYILLSNLYAADSRWDGVLEVRKLINKHGIKKPTGCSWIEVDGRENVFMSESCCSHPQRINIYSLLGVLDRHMRGSLKQDDRVDAQLLECN